MKKQEVQKRVLQNGKKLNMNKFEWDEKNKVFSTIESNLVIDFNDICNCTFNTGWNCTFKTGSDCTFNIGSNCTFNTGSNCTFYTGSNCMFRTGRNCTFKTGSNCTFNIGSNCTFNTGSNCTFYTGSNCMFRTGRNCTFDMYKNGYINTTHKNNSVIIVRYEENIKIYNLNEFEENKLIQFDINLAITKDIADTN